MVRGGVAVHSIPTQSRMATFTCKYYQPPARRWFTQRRRFPRLCHAVYAQNIITVLLLKPENALSKRRRVDRVMSCNFLRVCPDERREERVKVFARDGLAFVLQDRF